MTHTQQLESILEIDQSSIRRFRSGEISLGDLTAIRKNHLDYIKNLLGSEGFPFKDTFSDKAYKAAFLTVQHSEDVPFMKSVIEIFNAANKNQVEKRDLAYLVDRVRVLEGVHQLYGTQYRMKGEDLRFFPIEDESNLEERRRSMGMETFAEYKKTISSTASDNKRP